MTILKTRNNDSFPFSNDSKLKFQNFKWNPRRDAITKHQNQPRTTKWVCFLFLVWSNLEMRKMLKMKNVVVVYFFNAIRKDSKALMKRSETYSSSKANKNHTWDNQVCETLLQLKQKNNCYAK